MSLLLNLTLVWVALIVLALVVFLSATALYLHSARKHLAAIATGLEKAAGQCEPLEAKIGAVGGAVGSIKGSMESVDTSLGAIIEVVGRLSSAKAESHV